MKTVTQWRQIEQYHSKCVCQTCSCHKHKCPHADVHIPTNEISSYQNDYHKHPINTWQKPPAEKPRPYQPYGDINSSYKTQYPGYKPEMRQKLKPRVKDENKNLPFQGESEYSKQFPRKAVSKDTVRIKDREWTPDVTPFVGSTTYGASYPKKKTNPHEKKKQPTCDFPEGYGFDGSTTYGNSYVEKPIQKLQSCKPEQRVAPKGFHDLSSIYRDNFTPKPLPDACPILKMPERPRKVGYPNQHLVYNKHSMKWEEK